MSGPLRSAVYDRFMDLFDIFHDTEMSGADTNAGQVKLWSVFRMHGPEIKKGLEKVCNGIEDFGGVDSQIEVLGKTFEERVDQAKEMVLAWEYAQEEKVRKWKK